jgi:citronellol/citronellal dehydrogenase
MSLRGKTLFITGASRGIGKAIALRAARDGANVVVAAKTTDPHPRLEGTIFSAAAEIEAAGGHALPVACDIRSDAQIEAAVAAAVERFGGIDVLVNNASAISLTGTLTTEPKRFDLMHQINLRGTFMVSRACVPHLVNAERPHVINLSPPLNLDPAWFAPHTAYTIAKYGMSLCVLGMAEEFKGRVAFNALWPRTVIATAAVQNVLGGDEMMRRARKPEILADAAYAIVHRPVSYSGHFLLDEDVLAGEGVTDLTPYACDPALAHELVPDLFV